MKSLYLVVLGIVLGLISSFVYSRLTVKEESELPASSCESEIIHEEQSSSVSGTVEVAMGKLNQDNSPIKKLRRVNEASRFFEDILMAELDRYEELSCGIPKTAEGREQRSGYPDLKIVHKESKVVAYLDPKIFEESGINSSLRSFYFGPKVRTSKINDDALHLLLGISHDGKDGNWMFTGWHLVDLYQFQVKLKAEFQGANRDLYKEPLIIREERISY